MSENRLAAILEASLAADGLYKSEQQTHEGEELPSKRKIKMKPQVEHFDSKPQEGLLGELDEIIFEEAGPFDSNKVQNSQIMTPSFPSLNLEETKKESQPDQFQIPQLKFGISVPRKPTQNSTKKDQKPSPSKDPPKVSLLGFNFKFGGPKPQPKQPQVEVDEFEEDGMGEVYEYAMYSANVNDKESSESSSEEFDLENNQQIQIKPSKPREVPKESPKEAPKESKKIDLKTRGIKAQAKLQQLEMKAEPPKTSEEQEEPKENSEEEAPKDEFIEVEIKPAQELSRKSSSEESQHKITNIEEIKESIEPTTFYSNKFTIQQAIQEVQATPVTVKLPPTYKSKFSFSKLFKCFRSSPSALKDPEKITQVEKILSFSKEPMDPTNFTHMSIMLTAWNLLKGTDCSIYGEHWKELGFLSDYPGDELRNSGMMGAVSVLFLSTKSPQVPGKFGFLVISMTELALELLEKNYLNNLIKKHPEVVKLFLEFVTGLVASFQVYKAKLTDFNSVKKQLESLAKSKPAEVLRASKKTLC